MYTIRDNAHQIAGYYISQFKITSEATFAPVFVDSYLAFRMQYLKNTTLELREGANLDNKTDQWWRLYPLIREIRRGKYLGHGQDLHTSKDNFDGQGGLCLHVVYFVATRCKAKIEYEVVSVLLSSLFFFWLCFPPLVLFIWWSVLPIRSRMRVSGI